MVSYPDPSSPPFDALQVFYDELRGAKRTRRDLVQAGCTIILYAEGMLDPNTVLVANTSHNPHLTAHAAAEGMLRARKIDVAGLLKLLPVIIQILSQLAPLVSGATMVTTTDGGLTNLPGEPVASIAATQHKGFPGQA